MPEEDREGEGNGGGAGNAHGTLHGVPTQTWTAPVIGRVRPNRPVTVVPAQARRWHTEPRLPPRPRPRGSWGWTRALTSSKQ